MELTNLASKIHQSLFFSKTQNPIAVMCKEFTCYVELSKMNKIFWFTGDKSKNSNTKSMRLLNLVDSNELSFNSFIMIENDNVKQLLDEYLIDLLKINKNIGFIILMKFLYSADIELDCSLEVINHKNKKVFINELYSANKFSCELNFEKYLQYLNKFTSLLPNKCSYTISSNWWENIESKSIFIDSLSTTIKLLSSIHIWSIYIISKLIKQDYELICDIISSPKSKYSLNSVTLVLDSIYDVLYLIYYQNVLTWILVNLKYTTRSDTEDTKEVIREAKNKFFKKAGIIASLKIDWCE